MLRLILGRALSGKTTYVRNIIAENLNGSKKIILVVPEQFSLENEKSVIELLGAKKAAEIQLLSFSSMAKKILDEYDKHRKPPVNDAAKAVIMSMALESVEEHLDIFKNCSRNKKNVAAVLNMTDEIIRCDIDFGEMQTAAENSGSSALVKKTQELQLISEAYEMLLTARFSDERYSLNRAAEIAAEKKLFSGATVIFDEFSGFTAQENLLIAEILKQSDDVYVTMCAEGIHDSTEGTGVFSYTSANIGRLISLANKNNVSVAEPVVLERECRFSSDAISCLERGIYTPNPDIYEKDAPEITVAAANNPYDECEFAAMSAKRLVREKGIRYRDIVFVSRNSEYEKYIPFALKKYDIPIFEDKRRSLDNEIIVIFTLSALSLAVNGFTTDCMMRYLKTFLTGIDEEKISDIENYVLMWQIDYSAWTHDWTGHPDGFGNEFDEDAENRLSELNKVRKQAVFPIIELKEALKDCDGFGCVKAVYDFLLSVKADKNLLKFALEADGETAYDCEKSWDEFMDTLSLLADTIGERNITPERFFELFKIMVSSSDIGDIPSGLDEITYGDADRIRVSGKKVLFILGANEGVFPAASQSSFVITENERRLLLNNGIELGDDSYEKTQKERLRVYSTMSIPSDELYVSYSTGGFDGKPMSPSEIVLMTQKIIPRCRKVEISFIEPISRVESYQSAFESAAAHFNDKTDYSESVKKFVSDNPDYGDMMASVERASRKVPAEISDSENARQLFGKDIYITPSRVEEYYKCPFKYFCRYGLKANPINRAAFDSRQNGLLIHCVMERLFVRFGSNGLRDLTENEMIKFISEETDKYISANMGSDSLLGGRMLYSLERSKKTILEILLRLASEFADSRFVTRDVELPVGGDGDIPSYRVDIPDGGSAYISGVVDRIDTMESENGGKTYLRVIDYKTGGKDFNLADILSGLNMQMLVYLVCLFDNGKDRYGDIVPAGLLYVPAKNGKNSLGRNAAESEIEAARIENGKMKGIVLCDSEVIYGMEKDGGGLIIDAKIDKNGVIKGKTFDLHQFELLHKAVDSAVERMAYSLHQGKIAAEPIIDGAYKNTCDYCDYKSVCCREEGDSCKTLFRGDVWEALEARENG